MTSRAGLEDDPTSNYPDLPSSRFADIHNWNYADRRQMQEVCANVFLGPYACAAKNKLDSLKVGSLFLMNFELAGFVGSKHRTNN